MQGLSPSPPSNCIVGCKAEALSDEERELFAQMRPLGLILFARNIVSKAQLSALTKEFRELTQNPYALVLIDQEGGRVSRLPAAHWRIPPSPTLFAQLFRQDKEKALRACYLNNQLIAFDLRQSGVNVNCAPMLDIPQANASTVVTDRALGNDPEAVIALGEASLQGFQSLGVEGVIKHAPGHGRGTLDSHKALPTVDASLDDLIHWDMLPFKHFQHESMLMTAHIRYTSIDEHMPCTLSSKVINEVIRGHIGFDGLIMTDDIDMHALSGSIQDKASQALEAGCDVVLQCSGHIEDLRALSEVVNPLHAKALARAEKAAYQARMDNAKAISKCEAIEQNGATELTQELTVLLQEI